jgi:hypothetical protein
MSKNGTRHYVVSKVDRRSVKDPNFTVGVTIEYWNGVPFDRAVELHAECETGGRPDSRIARALESLTFRALEYGPPPNEEWVVLNYVDRSGRKREIRLDWQGFDPQRAPTASTQAVATRRRLGINLAAEAVRRAKKFRFNYSLWRAERMQSRGSRAGPRADFSDFITARSIATERNWHFPAGYVRTPIDPYPHGPLSSRPKLGRKAINYGPTAAGSCLRGNITRKTVPRPGDDSISKAASSNSHRRFTMDRPMPSPCS